MKNKFLNGGYIAHKGFHNDKLPPNTIGAFENAIKHGFAYEIDVRLSKDDKFGILHDENLKDLCGVDVNFEDIDSKDFDKYKIQNSDFCIPSLAEVLNLTSGKVAILIDVKCLKNAKKMAKALYVELKDYNGEYAVQSSNPIFLHHFYKLMPNATIIYLCSKTWEGDKTASCMVRKILYSLVLYNYSHAKYIACQYDEVNNNVIKKSKGNLILWTIRNADLAKKLDGKYKGLIFENFTPNITPC